MTDACNTCGKTTGSLMNCKKCKSVAYCNADCQKLDWKAHKLSCQRREFAGAPCDFCGTTENVLRGGVCSDCGVLSCKDCLEQHLTRDLSGNIISHAPCPRCNARRDFRIRASDCKKLEKLIKDSPRDPRRAHWLVVLGIFVSHLDGSRIGERKAKEHFMRAAELGYAEGFSHIAEIHVKNQNWDEARRYYKMAADKFHVISICNLLVAFEAYQGYFDLSHINITQEDHRREPDLEESFRLYQEGARLGHPLCCQRLSSCYVEGIGTEVNLAKGFKWTKVAAEKGDTWGMAQCGNCYLFGKGVEQSDEQAIYWYEKCLELEDNEAARNNLKSLLRRRSTGSS